MIRPSTIMASFDLELRTSLISPVSNPAKSTKQKLINLKNKITILFYLVSIVNLVVNSYRFDELPTTASKKTKQWPREEAAFSPLLARVNFALISPKSRSEFSKESLALLQSIQCPVVYSKNGAPPVNMGLIRSRYSNLYSSMALTSTKEAQPNR